jgi:MFS family permease
MEKIISLSFNRFKSNFLRYLLVYALSLLSFLAATIALVLTGGLLFLVYNLLGKPLAVGIILGVFYVIGAFFGLIYLGTWVKLSQVFALVKNKEAGEVAECFKNSRSLVFPFIIFGVLNSLFMIGLFYTNILFFIPFIIWAIWGAFSLFSFLDGHRTGLGPLWHSRSKIDMHFGKVLLYFLVFYAVIFVIMGLVAKLGEQLSFVNGIFTFLISPLSICYSYELYLSLPEPAQVSKPKAWLLISLVGWILLVVAIIFSVNYTQNNFKNLFDQNFSKQLEKSLKQ